MAGNSALIDRAKFELIIGILEDEGRKSMVAVLQHMLAFYDKKKNAADSVKENKILIEENREAEDLFKRVLDQGRHEEVDPKKRQATEDKLRRDIEAWLDPESEFQKRQQGG